MTSQFFNRTTRIKTMTFCPEKDTIAQYPIKRTLNISQVSFRKRNQIVLTWVKHSAIRIKLPQVNSRPTYFHQKWWWVATHQPNSVLENHFCWVRMYKFWQIRYRYKKTKCSKSSNSRRATKRVPSIQVTPKIGFQIILISQLWLKANLAPTKRTK